MFIHLNLKKSLEGRQIIQHWLCSPLLTGSQCQA